METITAAFVRQCLPRRDPEGHKGDFGKVLCICGSVGYTGAPIFASRAAVRTGAGLVLLGVPQSVWPVAAVKSDEAMPFPLPETADGKLSLLAEEPIRQRAAGCDAVLLGCGLGRDWQTDTLVQDLLNMEKPLVLDADGLNAISENAELLQRQQEEDKLSVGVAVLSLLAILSAFADGIGFLNEIKEAGSLMNLCRENIAYPIILVIVVLIGFVALVVCKDSAVRYWRSKRKALDRNVGE